MATIDTMSQSDLAASPAAGGEQNSENVPAGLVCPACGSKLIRRSMRRTFKDRFLSLLGRWPYRCQMCHYRFNGPQDPASLARENAPPEEDVLEPESSPGPDKPNH